MRTIKPWKSLRVSVENLLIFVTDSVTTVTALTSVGVATLVVHKSVAKMHAGGVPSLLILGMEIVDACIWLIEALTVLWLCGTAAIRFCKKIAGD